MKRKVLATLLTTVMITTALVGCSEDKKGTEADKKSELADGSEKEQSNEEAYEIGIVQLMQHPALDAANEGFIKALDDAGVNYVADQQNASGEAATNVTIADKFVNDKKDLILAIATSSAQAAAGATEEIPILGTAITDYEVAGLVESNDAPGGNLSGTSDMNPIEIQLGLIDEYCPDAKELGVFYSSDEDNSILQADMFEKAAELEGYTVERFTISNSNEIEVVMQSMEGKVDAIYIPTDNKLAQGMPTVGMLAEEMLLPVFCGEGNMVKSGGFATYGLDYFALGYETGKMAVEILENGADVSAMPIRFLPEDKFELIINEEMAKVLGITVTE